MTGTWNVRIHMHGIACVIETGGPQCCIAFVSSHLITWHRIVAFIFGIYIFEWMFDMMIACDISFACGLGGELYKKYPIECGSPFIGTTFQVWCKHRWTALTWVLVEKKLKCGF